MALGVPFGNYRLVRRIARGGMAEVFLAWQLSTSLGDEEGAEPAEDGDGFYDSTTGIRFARQVAVKRILPHLSESDEFRALFLQEARLAATLSHPNVVHIYDFGRSGDCLFLAMELIEGVGLGTLVRAARDAQGQMPVEHALRIAADALAGLHHAHTRTDAAGRPQHIVHRDVSPQNIMITLDGVVKILDFGIAKAAWSAQDTRPGVIRGKYAYMSPEQAEGQRLDGRSDVYAVGVCLYELLCGAPLVPRDLPINEALRAVRGGVALGGLGQLELVRPDLPPELHAILRRALQTRRDHRYGSAAEMQLDLERFLKGWPQMSSPLLLGEYLRERHLRPLVAAMEEHRESSATPVLAPSEASRPEAASAEAAPGAHSDGPTELRLPPERAFAAGASERSFAAGASERSFTAGASERSFAAGASEPTFVPAAREATLVSGVIARGTFASGAAATVISGPPGEADEPDDLVRTAKVALPTVLVARSALPTWRPRPGDDGDPDTARTSLPGLTLGRGDPRATELGVALRPADHRLHAEPRGGAWSRWAAPTWRALHGPTGLMLVGGAALLLVLALLWLAWS